MAHLYVADPRRALTAGDVALFVNEGSINVARRGHDRRWRFAISVLVPHHPPKENSVHTIIVRMSLDPNREEDTVRHFQDDVVPWAKQQPGFVTGQWLRTADGERGMGVVVFESAETAEQAAQWPRRYRSDDARAWRIDGVDVYHQVATA